MVDLHEQPDSAKLSLINIFTRSFRVLYNHPKLLLITVFISVFDILFQLVFPQSEITDQYYPFVPFLFFTLADPIVLFISLLISFLVTSFFISWFLTSVKQIQSPDLKTSLSLQKSLRDSFRYLPSIIIATILVRGGVVTGGVLSLNNFYSMGLEIIFFLPLILVFLFIFQVVFSYLPQAIV
ncbi:MAG: hypothetical protein ACFFC7_14865, partial [Candidatus Hermodarchaeota archaeon]